MKPVASFNRFKRLVVSSGHIHRTVEITFKSAAARTVTVIGDSISSHLSPLPMRIHAQGIWRIQLRLAPGCYRYRFVVDGALLDDPHACSVVSNELGSDDCVVAGQ